MNLEPHRDVSLLRGGQQIVSKILGTGSVPSVRWQVILLIHEVLILSEDCRELAGAWSINSRRRSFTSSADCSVSH